MNIERYASPFNQVHYFAFFDAYYAVAVGPTTLMMCNDGEVRSPYSAIAMQQLEYTTANMEMKLELSVLVYKLVGLNSWNQGVTIVLCGMWKVIHE